MPNRRTLLVSVKPVYAQLLLSGVKTVELRRVRPQVELGCHVLLYASSPRMEMVGAARVAAVDCDHVEAIWRLHSVRAGIDRPTYDAYFEGSSIAVAISLTDVRALRRDIPLAELRRKIRDFRPPQSFRYLAHSEAAAFV